LIEQVTGAFSWTIKGDQHGIATCKFGDNLAGLKVERFENLGTWTWNRSKGV